jgi:hypothetical protein
MNCYDLDVKLITYSLRPSLTTFTNEKSIIAVIINIVATIVDANPISATFVTTCLVSVNI